MAEVTMVAALNAALRDALAGDPRTLVFGEDVGALGGVFRVTEGLQAEFGARARVRHADRRGRDRGDLRRARDGRVGARSPRCSSTGSPTPRSTR